MKISKQLNYKNLVRSILVIFMVAQPLLDIFMSLFDKSINVFDVSLATVIRFAVVFFLLVTVIFNERKRKPTVTFLVYAGVIAVYTVFHHINAAAFSVKLAEAEYSIGGELLYLARMCVPIAIIYILYMVRLRYKDIKNIVVWSSFIISLVIIVTNLLEVGFVAYKLNNTPISGSMVDWFTSGLSRFDWRELSCRGLFQSTNQLSGVVIMLTPVLTYICLKEKKAGYWAVMAMHLVGMINISTRVATVGGPAVFLVTVLLFLLEKMIHKQVDLKKILKSNAVFAVSCMLITLVFLANSPMSMRAQSGAVFDDVIADPDQDIEFPVDDPADDPLYDIPVDDSGLTKNNMIKYIENNLATAGIQDLFIKKAYPYTDDPEFWYDVIRNVPLSQRYGNRNMRGYIIERVLERDGRISNYLVGISHTRSSSFIWPERDIETHLDSLGILGTALFIGPYLLLLAWGVVHFFKRFTANLHLGKCVYLITCGVGVVTGYFSGHIMNEIFPSLYLSLFFGVLLSTFRGDTSVEKAETDQ